MKKEEANTNKDFYKILKEEMPKLAILAILNIQDDIRASEKRQERVKNSLKKKYITKYGSFIK